MRGAVSVRLGVPGGADSSATWPVGTVDGGGATVDVPVADAGDVLGVLTVEMPPGREVRARELALLRGLASAAVVPFRAARLSAELEAQVEALDRATQDLEASRRRLITAGDSERSRVQRELALRVVSHLTGLPARLERLAAAPVAAGDLDPLVEQVVRSLEALRDLTRGVYPAQLVRSGLEPALRSLVSRSAGARLHADAPDGHRWPLEVEAAAYAFVSDALRALAAPADVALEGAATELVVVVRGSATGPVALDGGRDRVEAAGGTLHELRSPGRVTLEARLPAAHPLARLQAADSRTGPSSDLVT